MRVTTPEAILSYPNLFTARRVKADDDPKYSCTLIFPEGTDLTELMQAALEVGEDKFGKDAKKKFSNGSLKWPFRNDVEAKGYDTIAGEGAIFINVRSTRQPGVVAAYADPETGKPAVITDPDVAYPGVFVRGLLECYPYDVGMNKGVTFGLTGIQVLRKGERLDGRVKAEDAFEVDPDASPEDFAELPGAVEAPEAEGEEEEEAPPVVKTKSKKVSPMAALMP